VLGDQSNSLRIDSYNELSWSFKSLGISSAPFSVSIDFLNTSTNLSILSARGGELPFMILEKFGLGEVKFVSYTLLFYLEADGFKYFLNELV
jgi:hypothetical protein